METEEKECKTCEKKLPLSEFYLRKAAPVRYQSKCKECYKEKRRVRYAENKEVEKERNRNYFKSLAKASTFLKVKKKKVKVEKIKTDESKIERTRRKSRERYQKQKAKLDKYWRDYEARKQKEINDLL